MKKIRIAKEINYEALEDMNRFFSESEIIDRVQVEMSSELFKEIFRIKAINLEKIEEKYGVRYEMELNVATKEQVAELMKVIHNYGPLLDPIVLKALSKFFYE